MGGAGAGVEWVPQDVMTPSERCQELFFEAIERDIDINGKLCNAVMLGFGSDLQVRVGVCRLSSSEISSFRLANPAAASTNLSDLQYYWSWR